MTREELQSELGKLPKVLTCAQVAKLLKVSPRVVGKWFDSHRLKGYRIPGSNDRRILADSVIPFIEREGLLTETPDPTAHEIKREFLQFIAYVATVRPRNTKEWMDGLVEEATKAAKFLGYSGRYELRGDIITWREEQ